MNSSLQDIIDTAALTLVTADITNLQDLGKLYTCFEQLNKCDELKAHDEIKQAIAAVQALIKTLMLDETARRNNVQEILSKTITAIQHRIIPGTNPCEYPFPDELLGKQSSVPQKDTHDDYRLPAHIDETIFFDFLSNQDTVFEKLDALLLDIEKQFNAEQVADVRRIFHTLKGEAAIFELHDIQQLCHKTEDLLQSYETSLPIDSILMISDWLKSAFTCLRAERKLLRVPQTLQKIFDQATIQQPPTQKSLEPLQPKSIGDDEPFVINRMITPPEPVQQKTIQIISADMDLLSDFISEVKEHIESIDTKLLTLERNPHDTDLLNAVFRVFHTIKGAAGFLALEDIARLAHITENLLDLARKGELVLESGKIDVIFLALDEMKKLIKNIEKAITKGSTSYERTDSLESVIERIQKLAKIQQPLTTASFTATSHEHTVVSKPPAEPLEKATESGAEEDATLSIQKVVLATQEGFVSTTQGQKGKIKEAIKVDSDNLDKLIDSIGELVIIESMIKQDSDLQKFASARLQRIISQMDKITRELQQLGMSLRMIPVKGTFQKMARVVRDLAKKSGKDIEFAVRGENTMLDKSVVDRIGDPLIHLVRNAVDHGIEKNPEERIKAGKRATGSIELTAFHKGGNIYIEIKDDGRGLNKDLILEKAKQKGLLREGQNLSDREIFNFIFLPGFSTAQKVTDVSGRGVGMDVVKRAIEDLRGNIDIDSIEGKGTTFSLRLPLTLAIIDGMLVRIGEERYIIPTLSIVEAVRPKPHEIVTVVNRGEMLQLRDKLIPLFRLSRLFRIETAPQDPTQCIIIVVEESGKMAGLLVDELLGQQSTVIKSLGAFMNGLIGISGGSIMSDGKVGIIVDVAGIIKLATSQQDIYQEQSSNI